MSQVQIAGGLQAGDLSALSALTEDSGTAIIGERLMRDLVLAEGAADTLVLVARGPDGPVGYAHISFSEDVAWLVSGAVDPRMRRRGIGGRLLSAVRSAVREHGADRLRISGRPQGYAAPGVDTERDPGSAAFLEAHGARPQGSALAMHRSLHDLGPARDPVRVPVGRCEPEEIPALLDLVYRALAPEWADGLHRYAAAGGDLGRILLARDEDGNPAGFACWGVIGRDPARFGPFGVIPSARGIGAGSALLDRSLRCMAGEGIAHAWFQWTTPESPAHRLYTSRGFNRMRTFTTYELECRRPRGATEHRPSDHAPADHGEGETR